MLQSILTSSCHVLLPTEGGQINNNVGPGPNMSQQHPYPALSQLAHVYEQQQPQQQSGKELNKYASLKAVGECVKFLLFILFNWFFIFMSED